MASIIVFNDGGDTSVHVSDLDKVLVAQRIAQRFDGFSTDDETTSIVANDDETARLSYMTVVLTNENADDGSGPDHDLAHVLDFTPDALRWALAQTNQDAWGENERLREAGVL